MSDGHLFRTALSRGKMYKHIVVIGWLRQLHTVVQLTNPSFNRWVSCNSRLRIELFFLSGVFGSCAFFS